MSPSRAYIPSRPLLRALLQPFPRRCMFARPIPAQFLRRNGSKASKPSSNETTQDISDAAKRKFVKDFNGIINSIDGTEGDTLPDEVLDDPNLPTVSWYEQDVDRAGPERLISRLATPEDRRRHNELSKMMDEDLDNPNYDDALLRRRLLDDLITNPNFTHLTEELQAMRANILTREESKALKKQVAELQDPFFQELASSTRITTHESIQELIDDPALADARDDLKILQEKLPEQDEAATPEFAAALQRVEERLAHSEVFQRKMVALRKEKGVADDFDVLAEEEDMDIADDDAPVDTPEAMDKLLVQMKDLMGVMGGDNKLQADIDAALNEDVFDETSENMDKELDFDGLSQELTKLIKSSLPADGSVKIDESGDVIDPELEAKVNQIMKDPKLLQKIMYIKQLITEEQSKADDITTIAHETAPDPFTLETSRTATLKDQMKLAKSDPEHLAALRRLRVNLSPPFNISPALKSFNQAIELSYIGANDDIRRILWRAYSRARTLPTFLQNLSDDAWDLLYYSQAVTWGSNQNRQDHLKTLLQDLRRVGREGPPTHPSTLVRD